MTENLSEYGMDSISLTKFANSLNDDYSLELTPATLFEHTTLESLANYLVTSHQAAMLSRHTDAMTSTSPKPLVEKVQRYLPTERVKPTTVVKVEREEDIAVIGMSGIFPGSPDLSVFWQNLVAQKDLITEIPNERWNWEDYYGEGEGQTKVKWGGFIDGIDQFDPGFFNISPHEAELMDPQQRIFIEAVWRMMEDQWLYEGAIIIS